MFGKPDVADFLLTIIRSPFRIGKVPPTFQLR